LKKHSLGNFFAHNLFEFFKLFSFKVSEYQQYQDATADDEVEYDAEITEPLVNEQ